MDKIQKVGMVTVRYASIELYLGRKKRRIFFKVIFATELHMYFRKHTTKLLELLTEVECLALLTNG